MNVFAIFIVVVGVAIATEVPWLQFRSYVKDHGKSYEAAEHKRRFGIFRQNLNLIKSINAENEAKGRNWKAGLGPFTDWTVEEWRATQLSERVGQQCSATQGYFTGVHTGINQLPIEIDWRERNVVTPVKNQGNCGSCWTFSTTGCLESHHALKTGNLVTLSEQNLVDCAQAFKNYGCNGGLPSQAFEFIRYNNGLESEAAYPYKGIDEKCGETGKYSATVSGVFNITTGDEDELHAAVGGVGPTSIAYDCADDFMHYKSGIYSSDNCSKSSDQVNHAVLAVGYGVDKTTYEHYWIVKNSWAASWGEDGYFKIRRGTNECGLSQCASYPIV